MNLEINNQLTEAYYSEDLKVVRLCLLMGGDSNLRLKKSSNMTLLHRSPTLDITKLLLSRGADVNARDNKNRCPLHYTVIYNKGLAIMNELILKGAEINAVDMFNQTPLHYSVILQRELIIVQELLKHGAEVNIKDVNGCTPLHLAICFGNGTNLVLVMELMKYGGSEVAVLCNTDGYSPLDMAINERYTDCAKLIIKMNVLKYFESYLKAINNLEHYIGSPDYNELLHYLEDCICEITQMKTKKVNNKYTLHSFVLNHNEKSSCCEINETIEEDVSTKYSIYQALVLSKVQLILERRHLLNKLKELHLLTQCCRLFVNYDCTYKIAEYLENGDLTNLITAINIYMSYNIDKK